MTELLARAFEQASKLSVERQDELARGLLEELVELRPQNGASASPAHRREIGPEAALAQLVREGWLTPPKAVPSTPPPRLPVAPCRDLMKELEEDRGER